MPEVTDPAILQHLNAGAGPVYGPPPAAPSQADQQRLANDDARLRLAENADQREQDRAKLGVQKQDNLKASSIDSVKAVLESIDDVENDVKDSWFNGLGETGYSGWMLRNLPGSAAYNIQRKIDMIDANTAFSKLQEMRQNSPTGGAVGNVSDSDLRLLKSTIASLDPNQSQGDFLAALHKARRAYRNTLARLEGKQPEEAKPAGDGWKIEQVGD